MVKFTLVAADLEQHIQDFSVLTGRTIPDVTRNYALKPLVRYALQYTPPSSASVQGLAAKRAGEAAISRDLNLMGFQPVTIKGRRAITQVFGRPLARPIYVETKENPRFADPEAIRRGRLNSLHGGKPTRGGKQAWYVDIKKFKPMLNRLFAEVGRLASGWVPAARELGVPVPAWIARHGGSDRGTTVQTIRQGARITLRVVNHFPDNIPNKIYEDTIRRIETFKGYVADSFARQIKANLEGKWGKR